MKTIRVEFGIDTATTENIDMDKYLLVASNALREQLPEYKFICSVNQDDNAETLITNENEFDFGITQTVNEAIIEAESSAINDTRVYKLPILKCLRCEHTWNPRSIREPKFCPNCNSPYWDKERK